MRQPMPSLDEAVEYETTCGAVSEIDEGTRCPTGRAVDALTTA